MISQRTVKIDHAVQCHPHLLLIAKLLTDAQALLKMLQCGRIFALMSMNLAEFVQYSPFLLLVAQLLAVAQHLLKILHGGDISFAALKNDS